MTKTVVLKGQTSGLMLAGGCTKEVVHRVPVAMLVRQRRMGMLHHNKGEAVARRTLSVNGRYIRGYCLPDYTSKAESEVDEIVSYDDWKKYMNQYRAELRDNDSGTWSKEAREWAIQNEIFSGGGTLADGNPNYMWEDLLTREQAAAIMYKFAKANGLA